MEFLISPFDEKEMWLSSVNKGFKEVNLDVNFVQNSKYQEPLLQDSAF